MRNENYQRITMKQSIPTRKYIALFYIYGSGFVQDCLNIAVGCLHIHYLETLTSLEVKIEPATCISDLLARSGYFSFSILHTHFLMIAYIFLSFSGFLQKFYHLIGGSSFRSIGSSFPLIRSQLTQGWELPFRLR